MAGASMKSPGRSIIMRYIVAIIALAVAGSVPASGTERGTQRKREREQQLSSQLRAEQAKLTELESRLDGLEREIEAEVGSAGK